MTLYVIIADGELDQVCETLLVAQREIHDLRVMGCKVQVKQFATWNEVNAFEDKLNRRT